MGADNGKLWAMDAVWCGSLGPLAVCLPETADDRDRVAAAAGVRESPRGESLGRGGVRCAGGV